MRLNRLPNLENYTTGVYDFLNHVKKNEWWDLDQDNFYSIDLNGIFYESSDNFNGGLDCSWAFSVKEKITDEIIKKEWQNLLKNHCENLQDLIDADEDTAFYTKLIAEIKDCTAEAK